MSNKVNTWDPNDGYYPDIDPGTDFAQFYISKSGTFDGIDFKQGDYLIYLSQTDSFHVANGTVLLNVNGTIYPDPGSYTKVRIGANGTIIDAMDLSPDDIPEHEHNIKEVSGLEDAVMNILKDAFIADLPNGYKPAVEFKYDEKLKKIYADVDIDDETIQKNLYGQLTAIGGGEGGLDPETLQKIEVVFDVVDDITEKVKAFEKKLEGYRPVEGKGIVIDYLEKGIVINVDYDEDAFIIGADGKLTLNPDALSDLSEGGGNCANHEHTASQIKDLDKYILKIINNNSYKLDVNDIPIDETTIIINSKGQLSAVSAGVGKHKHTMSDVTDLDPDIADVWAVNQKTTESSLDLNNGYFEFSNITIGDCLFKINQAFKDLFDRVEELEKYKGKTVAARPKFLNEVTVVDTSVYEKGWLYLPESNKNEVECTYIFKADLPRVYPTTGVLEAWIDGVKVATVDVNHATYSDGLEVEYIEDYYKGDLNYEGFYNCYKAKFIKKGLTEGKHTCLFKHVVDDKTTYESNVLSFNSVEKRSSVPLEGDLEYTVDKEGYVSGNKYVQGEGHAVIHTYVETAKLTKVFTPLVREYTNGSVLEPLTIDSEKITFPDREVDFNPGARRDVVVRFYDIHNHFMYERLFTTPRLKVDEYLDIERCRVGSNISYSSPNDKLLQDWDGTKKVTDASLILTDGKAYFEAPAWWMMNEGCQDYTDQKTEKVDGKDYKFIALKFKCPSINSFYVDLVDENGNPFATEKGKLKDIIVRANVVSYNDFKYYIDQNIWDGESTFDEGSIFAGLDLQRSSPVRKYFTFGKQYMSSDTKNLYVVIGLSKGSLNIDTVIKSIEESLNGWR